MGGKKKFNNNNNNKFNNKPEEVKETVIQEEKLETITENPAVEAQTEVQEIKQEKQEKEVKKSRGRGRRKVKENEVKAENIAQTVINETSEIAPVIAEDAAKKQETPVAETPVNIEEKEVVAENALEETKTEDVATAEEKPKRTRRPNRNSQKRTRRTTKKNVEEE